MSAQLSTALLRAIIGAGISFGLTFVTALGAADSSGGKAAVTAGAAAFAYLAARG